MKAQELSQELWKQPKRLHNAWKMMMGEIQPELAQTPYEEIATWGKARLLKYSPKEESKDSPILMIPSIINKYYVLDLRPGQSYVEYLVQKGQTVYLLDWGTPGPQDRYLTLEDHVIRFIGAAVRTACKDSGKAKVHLMGYCIGGTFAILYAALRPQKVASLIALTAPVNFHDEGLLSCWASSGHLDIQKLADQMGSIPADFLQSSFSMLMPMASPQKYRNLSDKLWDEDFLDKFLSLETWLNDNISFPGATYVEYIKRLYENNELIKGKFSVGKELVDLSSISMPVLTVTASQDHIVPPASASYLHETIASTDKQLLALKGGHIGITVGSKAKEGLYSHTAQWLEKHPCPDQRKVS